MPIIQVEHLDHIYGAGLPDETHALRDVSFSVEEGEFAGIIGPTGCGKSTLISHFNGLARPSSGRVLIDGQDIWARPKEIRRYRFLVGLVFQYPEYQLFEETVYKDIAYGPGNMGLSAQEVRRRVLHAAALCGVEESWLEMSPFELSGGQKRRVAIAGVLAMQPRVLVLDEPAAGLDPEGRESILQQIHRYHVESGASVILVSHSMEDIARWADRVLVLHEGAVVMYDTTPHVFARAQELQRLGLSVPQVTRIFLELKRLGVEIDTDVYTVPYAVKTVQRALRERGLA